MIGTDRWNCEKVKLKICRQISRFYTLDSFLIYGIYSSQFHEENEIDVFFYELE